MYHRKIIEFPAVSTSVRDDVINISVFIGNFKFREGSLVVRVKQTVSSALKMTSRQSLSDWTVQLLRRAV